MDVRDAALHPAGRRLRRYHPTGSVINVLFRDYNSGRSAYVSIHASSVCHDTSTMIVLCAEGLLALSLVRFRVNSNKFA